MNLQKKWICLFLAVVMLAVCTPVQAVEIGSITADDTVTLQNNNIHGCDGGFYTVDTDGVYSFLCNGNVIPVDFSIYGFNAGEICTLQIESTIAMTHNLDSRAVYSEDNNHVTFEIQVQAPATMQSIESFYLADYEYITITLTTNGDPTQVTAIDLYIINSQYGLFVSSVGEESVFRRMLKTLYEDNYISLDKYDAAITTTYRDPGTPAEQLAVANLLSATRTSTPTQTTVTVEYTISIPSSGFLEIQGKVSWTDTNGVSHGARGVTVMVMDDDVFSDEQMASIQTDSSGNFGCMFSNQLNENGCDIYLKVLALTPDYLEVVMDTGDTCAINTSSEIGIHNNVTTEIPKQSKSFGQGYVPNGFQVHQAAYAAWYYAKNVLSRNVNFVKLYYPMGSISGYSRNQNYIQIEEYSFSSWDVIMHEYGHHIAYHEAIDSSTGGSHSSNTDLISTKGKIHGCHMAWSEGWATYFGIAAQTVPYTKNLGIPSVGDAKYESYANNVERRIEQERGLGEGNELAVAAVLWDLADASSSPGSSYENFDLVNLGFDTVASYTLNYKKTTFAEFLSQLYANGVINTTSTNVYNVGGILGQQRLTASGLYYDEMFWEFSFTVAQGSTNNPITYYLEIFDSATMGMVYYASLGTKTTSSGTLTHTLSTQNIQDFSDGDNYYWRVEAVTTGAPTAIYCSEYKSVYFGEEK